MSIPASAHSQNMLLCVIAQMTGCDLTCHEDFQAGAARWHSYECQDDDFQVEVVSE